MAVVTFGRFNPPTSGHELLLDKLHEFAFKIGGEPMVFLSQTQDEDKNPLTWTQKLKYMGVLFPQVKVVEDKAVRTPYEALKWLSQKGYKSVTFVIGGDRYAEFAKTMPKYNGKDYTFKELHIVNAGARDPDSDTVSGASASKLRELAKEGKYKEFKAGLPKTASDKLSRALFKDVRTGMQLSEDFILAEEQAVGVKQGKIKIPEYGDKSRKALPQIIAHDRFMHDLETSGIRVEDVDMPMGMLTPTQGQFDEDKVLKMMASTDGTKPIIVSRDGYIVDGHHRWLCDYNLGKRTIRSKLINLNCDQLLEFLMKKDYVQFKSINEGFAVDAFGALIVHHPLVKGAVRAFKHLHKGGEKEGNAINRSARIHNLSPRFLQDVVDHLKKHKKLETFA